jgi:fatty acid desaturase
MTNPPVNWGYPRTVEGFFHVLTRGQYEHMNPTADVGLFLEQVRLYFVMAGKEYGWPYLLLCLIPFCFLHRMAAPGRRWILGLLPAYVCLAFLMLAVLNPSVDRQSQELDKVYFSASYILLALWLGYGLIILGAWMARPGKQPETAHLPI